jgi:hypothetical protein
MKMLNGRKMANGPVDLDQLEHEISAATASLLPNGPDAYAPPPRLRDLPLPEYVTHAADISDLGKLTSAAVVSQYEGAAKDIEAMGKELIAAASQCEKMVAEVREAFNAVKETAALYRENGKSHFSKIEAASRMAERVRTICEGLNKEESHEQ